MHSQKYHSILFHFKTYFHKCVAAGSLKIHCPKENELISMFHKNIQIKNHCIEF